jgi:hypothetical protein
MQIYFALALTIAALVTWVMALRPPVQGVRPNALYFNLAPLAAAWLVALLTPAPENLFYKAAVLLGLLLAIVAIAIRGPGLLPSYASHAHLLITFALYGLAFGSQTSGWPTPYAILLIGAAGLLYYWLFPRLVELKISIAIYAFLILLATWQALELAVQQPAAWMGWVALAGMLLSVISILLEAQERFHAFRPTWAVASIPVFLISQLLIAWSVWSW